MNRCTAKIVLYTHWDHVCYTMKQKRCQPYNVLVVEISKVGEAWNERRSTLVKKGNFRAISRFLTACTLEDK